MKDADDDSVALGKAQNILLAITAAMAGNVLNARSDKEVVREIWRAHLLGSFAKSWLPCWNEGLYFDERPESIELRLLRPNREAIAEISTYEFFTLFETAILIEERVSGACFLGDSWLIFVDAIANNQLIPRHPDNYLRWVDLPLHQPTQIPDLSWVISRDELYEFASSRYPQRLFAELSGPGKPEKEPEPPEGTSESRKRTGVLRTSTVVIRNAWKTLLSRHNREPANIEVWNYLKSIAGNPDSGVAEFIDVETGDGDGSQEKIVFDTADGGLTNGITFKTLQNRLSELRKII